MGPGFHSDISKPAATAAGTFTLFDPGPADLKITHVRFSTNTAQHFMIGIADQDGQRLLAGWLGANAGALADIALDTADVGWSGKKIIVITTQASAFDAAIDGCYSQ